MAIMGAAVVATTGTSSLLAQPPEPQPRLVEVPGHGLVYVLPVSEADTRSQARIVNVPGYGKVYVVPVRPKDERTPRQRCIDEEIASLGGSPSRLALRSIGLKCSQR